MSDKRKWLAELKERWSVLVLPADCDPTPLLQDMRQLVSAFEGSLDYIDKFEKDLAGFKYRQTQLFSILGQYMPFEEIVKLMDLKPTEGHAWRYCQHCNQWLEPKYSDLKTYCGGCGKEASIRWRPNLVEAP